MIRIKLPEKVNYFDLQESYLEGITSCIGFDAKDVLDNSKDTGNEKSRSSAQKLQKYYPSLYRFLFEDINTVKRENLRRLLVGPDTIPESFGGNGEKFATMRGNLDDIIARCPWPQNGPKRAKAKEVCEDIFNYDKFTQKKVVTYGLLRKLDVRVCPYCNRLYTITLPSKMELGEGEEFVTTRAAFDHFYSKDEYPYLAVSLFNLIPSCHVCNMNKGTSQQKIIYPYDEEFGDEAVFRVIPDLSCKACTEDKGVLNFLHGGRDQFHIRFMGKEGISLLSDAPLDYRLADIDDEEYRKRIENAIELFRLERLYKEHKEEIRDILRNRYYFNEEYVKTAICPVIEEKMRREKKKKLDKEREENLDKEREENLNKEGEENLDKESIREVAMDMLFFTHMRQDKWGKRPLSKLITDILNQLSVE